MKLFRLFLLMIAPLLGFVACEENTQVDNKPDPVVELKVDKQVIVADGEDKATFTVFVDKVERTADCKIICLKDNSILEGRTFASTEAGEYLFKATFESFSSEAVAVTVETPDVDYSPVLVADKKEIMADGEDMVIFTVTFEGEDVTSKSTIINLADESALEDNSFATTTPGVYQFAALMEGNPLESDAITIVAKAVEEPGDEPVVTLEVDKSEILADGTDVATFTVKADGEVVTEDVFVFYLATNKPVKDMQFSTTEAGEHKFLASYGSYFSNEVTITATEVETPEPEPIIALSADKSEFVADGTDKVTFTVTSDEVALESGYTIYLVGDAESNALKGNEFKTTTAGEYKFKAVVDEYESEVITITATEPEVVAEPKLTLSADKVEIVADGTDAVVFDVEEENFDTEDAPLIYNLADNSVVRGPFTTTTAGTYEFVARKGDVESNKVTVVAKAVEVEEPEQPEQPAKEYKVGDYYEENGVKGIVYAFAEIAKYNDSFTEIVGYDKYCYLFSMDQVYIEWSTENVQCNAMNPKDGAKNMISIAYQDSTYAKYPAAKWCADHGEGWYLPSSNELHMMWDAISGGNHVFTDPTVAAFNKTLTDNGGNVIEETFYWTSNEVSESHAEVVCFSEGKGVCLDILKAQKYDVRAIYKFKVE